MAVDFLNRAKALFSSNYTTETWRWFLTGASGMMLTCLTILGAAWDDSDIKRVSWGHAIKMLFPTVLFLITFIVSYALSMAAIFQLDMDFKLFCTVAGLYLSGFVYGLSEWFHKADMYIVEGHSGLVFFSLGAMLAFVSIGISVYMCVWSGFYNRAKQVWDFLKG